MSDETKTYGWLPWAVSIGLAVVIGWIITKFNFEWAGFIPWHNAAVATYSNVSSEIYEWGGLDIDLWNSRLKSLVTLAFLFIIGPSLLIFSEIKNQHKTGEDRLKKGFTWYAGSILVTGSLILFTSGAVTQVINYQKTSRNIKNGKINAELRHQMFAVGLEAAERYFIPKEKGGLGGSFESITLGDLSMDDKFPESSFVIGQVESDSMFTLYLVGDKEGQDPDFKNANGEQGKMQRSAEIIPEASFMRLENNNNN